MPSSLHLRPRLSDLLEQRDIRLGVVGGHINAGTFESVLHHGGNPTSGGKGPAWSVASNEDMIGINVAGPAFQIAEQSVADILREWQPHLVSPFPRHLQCAIVPVDVGETETRHISGAQS